MPVSLHTPFTLETITGLRAGTEVLLSGEIFTARDAAHARMVSLLDEGKPPPLSAGQIIYYAGPCPAPEGKVIGSVGPTTSKRMDAYTPRLMRAGLTVTIGKGPRTVPVLEALRAFNGAYLAAVGGTGALLARCVERAVCIAFEDLGPEAIFRLTMRDMPLVVAADCHGGNIYGR